MTKLKVTVVKCFTNEEIFGDVVPDHLDSNISPCHLHHSGQVFMMESLDCPKGFCYWAYDDIYRDMAHLWMDGDFPFIGKPGTMFSSCTDGKKPVVFKLERIEG